MSDLRNRGSAVRTQKENQEIQQGLIIDKGTRYLESIAPEKIKPLIQLLGLVVAGLFKFIDIAHPFLYQGYVQGKIIWKRLEPYHPEEVLPMIFGMIMMLFGGHFMLTIACVEAYRMCGWDKTYKCFCILYDDYQALSAANEKDDREDLDKDGVADVLEITETELISRKLLLMMRTVDPIKVKNALEGIYEGFVAVIAVLRIDFGRYVSLGASIGDILTTGAIKLLHAPLAAICPEAYVKWIDVGINYFFKFIGVSIAWFLARILSAFHSALRGAQIFTSSFASYTYRLGYYKLSEGYWDEIFAGCAALFGLKMQLSSGFTLPWFLSLPLLPLTLFEHALEYIVAYDAY